MPHKRRKRKSRLYPEPHIARRDFEAVPSEQAGKRFRCSTFNESDKAVNAQLFASSVQPPLSPPLSEAHPSVHSRHEAVPASGETMSSFHSHVPDYDYTVDCGEDSPQNTRDKDIGGQSVATTPDTNMGPVLDEELQRSTLENSVFDFNSSNLFDIFDDALPTLDQDVRDFDPALETTVQMTDQHDSDDASRATSILNSVKSAFPRSTLIGIISLYGKPRMTLECYDHLRAIVRDADKSKAPPCVTTMRQRVLPRLLKTNFVKSNVIDFKQRPIHPDTSSTPDPSNTNVAGDKAVLVIPSEWAIMDIRSLHVLRELVCLDSCLCSRSFGQTDLRFVNHHEVISTSTASRSDCLFVNSDGTPFAATTGASVELHFPPDICSPSVLGRVSLGRGIFGLESSMTLSGVVSSTEHVVHSSASSTAIEHGLPFTHSSFEQHELYMRCMPLLIELCETPATIMDSVGEERLQGETDHLGPRTRREKRNLTELDTEDKARLLPGDHLTFLDVGQPSLIAVVVSRFWVSRLTDDRNMVLLFHFDTNGETKIDMLRFLGAPSLIQKQQPVPQQHANTAKCYTKGKLDNGKTFYRYQILLYADDFNPRSTLFPKGSVGGLYLSPSSLHIHTRRSQFTIRTVCLTPPGISTNVAFDHIIDDLVNGSISGIECKDAFQNDVVVYLQVMGFVGDYPASSAVVDVKGHTALAPCTHCTTPKNRSEESSTFAYTTTFHSAHNAFRRTQLRSTSMHSLGLSSVVAKCLGMKIHESSDVHERGKCPLLKFAQNYNERVRTVSGSSHLRHDSLDGYDLNIIAPDHLVTGLFKGILTLCFIQMETDDLRSRLTSLLREHLLLYGFQTQSVLFKNRKLVPGLSMSTLYCILSLLPALLQSMGILDSLPPKSMLLHLHRFFCLSFWWPTIDSDGERAWKFVHGKHMHLYHNTLQRMASNFVKSVHTYCKSYPTLSSHIDRPNVHRLLELVIHTIPAYNHVSYICELVYESAHQPLKFYLSRNHSANSHIYAVQLILAKDWIVRLWCLWKIHCDARETDKYRKVALVGLLRLIGGSVIDDINWTAPLMEDHLKSFELYVHDLFDGTVEGRFQNWYKNASHNYSAEGKWEVHYDVKKPKFTNAQSDHFDRVIGLISDLSFMNAANFSVHSKVSLVRGYGSSSPGHHEQLLIGDIVQVLSTSKGAQAKIIDTAQQVGRFPCFFVIGSLVKSPCGSVWASVSQCKQESPNNKSQIPDYKANAFFKVSTSPFYETEVIQLLQLTGSIRKVGVVHDCKNSGCCTRGHSLQNNSFHHSETALTGGSFFLLTRSLGFPPRRS